MPEQVHHRFDDASSNTNGSTKTAKNTQTNIANGQHNSPTSIGRQQNGHHSGRQAHSLREKAELLLPKRQGLPIWNHTQEIRQGLKEEDVMLLVGETGSGKSTQVPQFLLDEPWCKSRVVPIKDGKPRNVKVGGCIAITEPRRVAAITLAKRVAEEMGTTLGSASPASKVGYSVRFDNCISPSMRIKFLTEGMLLQEMLHDPHLRQYSAVIVDEVHERGVNVDLIMGFLRRMVTSPVGKEGRGSVPLKLVVMSATADIQGLLGFFDEGFAQKALCNGIGDGNENSETINGNDTESEWSGISDPEEPTVGSKNVSVSYIKGRQFEVKTFYTPEPVQNWVEAALRTVFDLHHKEPLPGDVLVFLTGQETVESLESLMTEYAINLGPEVPKLLILPLFGALPQAAQQQVFQPTPTRTRKVILATNIAETSVTVPGVRFVVDCGKSKIKYFRDRLGLDSLLVKPISQSAAIQRKGRAGREAPGKCYRLYIEKDYLALAPNSTPEILRCDLAQAILNMKARGVNDIVSFPFLSPPSRDSLESALLQLYQLGALSPTGEINSLGLQIAKLPLSARLGRVLLAAPEAGCLSEVIDIISCLSVENVFLNMTTEEARERAEEARRALYRREGDHLTLLATIRAYAAENADRKAWAERHFVSHRAMQAVMVSFVYFYSLFEIPLFTITNSLVQHH